jgi:hypothetical protein
VLQVVVQELFQVVAGVEDTLAAVAEIGVDLGIIGLLEEQRPGGHGLEGAHVALAADAVVEDDAGAGQQAAVVGAEDAAGDDDPPALGESGQASQPGQALPLHGRVEIPHKKEVNISFPFRPGLVEEVAAQPIEVGGPGVA